MLHLCVRLGKNPGKRVRVIRKPVKRRCGHTPRTKKTKSIFFVKSRPVQKIDPCIATNNSPGPAIRTGDVSIWRCNSQKSTALCAWNFHRLIHPPEIRSKFQPGRTYQEYRYITKRRRISPPPHQRRLLYLTAETILRTKMPEAVSSRIK